MVQPTLHTTSPSKVSTLSPSHFNFSADEGRKSPCRPTVAKLSIIKDKGELFDGEGEESVSRHMTQHPRLVGARPLPPLQSSCFLVSFLVKISVNL